jgi:signal transduction histidine kinase/CheY-like chemotaxis protein
MRDAVPYLQNAATIAFVLLGVATAAGWLRHRERSLGFLALAIVLLSAVSLLGRLPALLHVNPTVLGDISLAGFMGSAYALLRYRSSIVPLRPPWHRVAVVAIVVATAVVVAAQALHTSRGLLTAAVIILVLVWMAAVVEPVIRFWLVARDLPAVQAWRLRSLSFGFGGLVAIILVAITIGGLVKEPVVQVGVELVVLAIVPLLYVSFSPPVWLRREWRASEEEGLRGFMEELLLSEDGDTLAGRALEWAMRLVGASAGVFFDNAGRPDTARSVTAAQVDELRPQLPNLRHGVNRVGLGGSEATVLMLPIKGLVGLGSLVVVAGPFTPGFGSDELNRVQQFMSAFVTALDRRHLIVQLAETNARLMAADRHKSAFLANMSHELRTPLNAIIGFSELLTDSREGHIDEATRKRFLDQILTSGRQLLGLINDILDLSKVEAGQMELRLQTVAVADVIDQVVRTVEPLVAKKSIRLESRAQDAGSVVADAGKLKQMLLNLVSNAIKFTPEHGAVMVAGSRTAGALELSVTDTGIGIADSELAQIFHEFHQVDHGPGRKHEGTGLGLALTRRFARLHGGDVRVRSEVGKGSVFTLTIPVRTVPDAVARPPMEISANGHDAGPLVLVVEDDAAAAELLTRQLVGAGYQTLVLRTGADVAATAARLKPSAITVDILLPDVDGWEVITRLKSDPGTRAIPIFVVSVVDDRDLGMALGAMDYFVKPVDPKELVRRLTKLVLEQSTGKSEVRVLVVDDEPANRELLATALEPAGFTVVLAAGGREAVEMARTKAPDLILLDLLMPEITGFEVVETLRSDERTRETPIMILTAATLTAADKVRLNGRVSEILSRGSVGTAELVGQLRRTIAKHNGHSA